MKIQLYLASLLCATITTGCLSGVGPTNPEQPPEDERPPPDQSAGLSIEGHYAALEAGLRLVV